MSVPIAPGLSVPLESEIERLRADNADLRAAFDSLIQESGADAFNAEMLALLKAVRSYHNGGPFYSMEAIDAAIAKAERTS